MCTHSSRYLSDGTLTIVLCRQLPFEHYKTVRDAITSTPGVKAAILDFSEVECFQSWIVGFILHLEDSLGLGMEIRNASAAGAALLRLGKLERFLVDGYRPSAHHIATASGRASAPRPHLDDPTAARGRASIHPQFIPRRKP